MKQKSVLLSIVLSILCLVSFAQTRIVNGKVTSSDGDVPLANVSVRLKGAITVAQTKEDGTFSIEVHQGSTDMLIFSHPDHDEIEFFLNGNTTAKVQMTVNIRYNQYGVRVNRNPLFVEERNGILVFENKDQTHRVWYDVRVQADGAMFFGETYNDIGNGTSIRRARFAVKTEFAKHWYAEFDMDIANSQLELKDAYLQRSFGKNFELRVGNFKESYSMESTTTSRYLTFMERPMAVHCFAPSRHIGLAANYNKNWLLALGGIYFQKVDDIEERTFSLDNNKDFGIDEGYSLTGKLVIMPFYNDMNKGLHFGVAGSYRTPKSDAEVAGTHRYSVRSLTSINRKKYMDTDLIGKVDNTTLGGFELAGYYKNIRIQSEYLMSSVNRLEDLETLNFDGGYVFGSWLLFGGKYNYNTSEGEFTQVTRGKSWGDVELALRFDYLSLNSDMETLMGGAGEGITFGLNYYANNNVKIMLNYAYLNHDRYASGKNKLFVGYDANGELTRIPQLVVDGKGKAGEDYSMISLRFEVDF
ncbi:MAG: porin [Bacteroidales bacterium]|nr:porin [Bacteroidales bacterium]